MGLSWGLRVPTVSPVLEALINQLDSCQIADRHRLGRRLRHLQKRKPAANRLRLEADRIATEIEASRRCCLLRAAAIPAQINYPPNLPVSARAAEIAELLRQHTVLVVAGDTGSGKTTQLPKICLQAGFGRRGLIGHTQPRRLAAVSVADRIADELGTQTGVGVGYQVRFNEKSSPSSYLKLMTDGILLAEIQQDRFLNRYEVIIVDEAHERSLNIDFLLGFLRQLLTVREDLKLIITSATIDVEKFSRHFDDAPVVAVSGRTYPVETRYAPLVKAAGDDGGDATLQDAIISAIEDISRLDRQQQKLSGDVLVFLSSEREIRETALALRKRRLRHTEVLPLYARLRHSEQVRIFKSHPGRRIVLATNVAETSITVPGIRYVIDSGLARISRYSLQSKVQRLPIEAISQASANQRQGRCGRLEHGICIRLYSEDDFNSRPLYIDAEIRRTNLASVILRMGFLRLGDIEAFPFLEPPEQKAINEGYKLLFELNALSQKRELTESGRKMAMLPVDPRYARMLVTANAESCLKEILIIVSALSIQDPRELSAETRQQALQKLAPFSNPDSDFLSFVGLWNEYELRRQELSQNQLRKYCRTHYLSFSRMREWREVHRQLLLACRQLGFRFNKEEGGYQAIHKSIIAGSLNQIATRVEGRTYLGNRNRKFTLFGSSVAGTKPARWIVTGELIETSRTFATLAAGIQPEWVEQMAPHLVKRDYFEPHWSKKRQQVMVYEKVQLYGLVIIEKSPMACAAVDQVAAREIFIRDGLGGDQIHIRASFHAHNRKLLDDLAKQEEKLRRPDCIVSASDIIGFYEHRIPPQICSTRQLEAWLNKQGRDADRILHMDRESLSGSEVGMREAAAYPDKAPIRHNRLQIDYVFDPADPRDGATIEVPAPILNQVTQADIDWAVPGIMREKCVALIKGLPKSLRKQFIPINEFVDSALRQMTRADGELLDALVAQIREIKRLDLKRQDFRNVELPAYLQVKVRVVDDRGEEILLGENIESIKSIASIGSNGGNKSNKSIESLKAGRAGKLAAFRSATDETGGFRHPLEQDGLKDWTFGELPEQVQVGGDLVLIRHPALLDRSDSVAVSLLADESEARRLTRRGLVRLYMLRSAGQKNMLRKKFSRFSKDNALLVPGHLVNLADDLLHAAYVVAFEVAGEVPRDRESFEKSLNHGKQLLYGIADNLERSLLETFTRRRNIIRQLQELRSQPLAYLIEDIELQLERLLTSDFLLHTGPEWLNQFPRFFHGIEVRLSKAPHVGEKDRVQTEELQSYWRRLEEKRSRLLQQDEKEMNVLRWMIEEYRVSLFAQSLGTQIPVSAKRLDRQLEKLGP